MEEKVNQLINEIDSILKNLQVKLNELKNIISPKQHIITTINKNNKNNKLHTVNNKYGYLLIPIAKNELQKLLNNKANYLLYKYDNQYNTLDIIIGDKTINPIDYITKENFERSKLYITNLNQKYRKTIHIRFWNKEILQNYNNFEIIEINNNRIKLQLKK